MFIKVEDYQNKILELITDSEELDRMISSSVFGESNSGDSAKIKSAVVYGMALASLYTCKCEQYMPNVSEVDTVLGSSADKTDVSSNKANAISEMRSYLDNTVHPSCDYSIYTTLVDYLDDIEMAAE